jgi:hypothetical protein
MILYWEFKEKRPWNENWNCYEASRTVVEVSLYNSITGKIAGKLWHHSLPLAEQEIKLQFPGVNYKLINDNPPF